MPEEMLGDDLLPPGGAWAMGVKSDAQKYFYVLPLGPVNWSLFCFEPVPGEDSELMCFNCAIMGAPDTRDWHR